MAVPSKLRHYLDRDGHQIRREESLQQVTSWDLLFYVLCASLDQVKSSYCEVHEAVSGEATGVYRHGHTVSDVRSGEGGRIEVGDHDLEGNKRSEAVDLVVGAAGPAQRCGRS